MDIEKLIDEKISALSLSTVSSWLTGSGKW